MGTTDTEVRDGVHIGVDVGTERFGLAISDQANAFALPMETVAAKIAVARIVELVDEREVTGIVVGWPLEMDGRAGRAVRRVEVFITALENALADRDVQIHTFDERLTTAAADAVLRETDIRRKKRGEVIDQVAATQILQGFIDANRGRA